MNNDASQNACLLEDEVVINNNDKGDRTTAIMVLGQCLNSDATPSAVLVSRLEACVKLQQRLILKDNNESCKCIMFTGGDTARVGITEAKVMQTMYEAITKTQPFSHHGSCAPSRHPEVILEENSLTTIWNAVFCLPLLRYKNVSKVHLITSDFHMPRSMLIFESIFQNVNIHFIRHAVPIPVPYARDDGINVMQPGRRFQHEYRKASDEKRLANHIYNQVRFLGIPPISEDRVSQCRRELEAAMQKAKL